MNIGQFNEAQKALDEQQVPKFGRVVNINPDQAIELVSSYMNDGGVTVEAYGMCRRVLNALTKKDLAEANLSIGSLFGVRVIINE